MWICVLPVGFAPMASAVPWLCVQCHGVVVEPTQLCLPLMAHPAPCHCLPLPTRPCCLPPVACPLSLPAACRCLPPVTACPPAQVFDIEKHWWALKMVELGHKVLYMDAGAPLPAAAAAAAVLYMDAGAA